MVNVPLVSARAFSCDALASNFSTLGLASLNVTLLRAGDSVALDPGCAAMWGVPSVAAVVDVCHIALDIDTSTTSRTHLDAWFPASGWNGRLLGTGTGGISGCVDFPSLGYGSSLGFATIGTDAGHSGPTGVPFLNAPEVLRDFLGRSIHTEAVVGKELVAALYGTPASHSYYMGCSQGGRQGFQAAEDYPYDFDGILAGDPALDMHNLINWFGIASKPLLAGTPGAVSPTQWALVHDEVFKQCDSLDGKVDRTVAYPDNCKFDPTPLLKQGFNKAQVDGLRKLYADVHTPDGKLLYPRFAPSAETTGPTFQLTFSGAFPDFTLEYFRYVVYSDPAWDPSNFSFVDVEKLQSLKLPGVALTGDLRKFKERGGKMLTYHGNQDTLINAGISERQYALTARVTGTRDIAQWYSLYLVPGMDHCTNLGGTATGPWRFGQLGNIPPPRAVANTTDSNALLALVDWVENGHSPKHLVGLTDAGEKREICKYPIQGHWRNGVWTCGK